MPSISLRGWKTYTVALGIAIIAIVAYRHYTRPPVVTFESVIAKAAPMQQLVSVTGKLKSQQSVDLGFSVTGRVMAVEANVGTTIAAGAPLVRLEAGDLAAQLAQAEAQAAAAQATLAGLKEGTRPEQIAVTEAQIASDQGSLAQAKSSLINAIQNAYTQSDDAIRNKADQFFNNPRTPTPTISFTSSNSQLVTNLQNERSAIEVSLSAWQTHAFSLTTESDLAAADAEAQSIVDAVVQLLADANGALNAAIYTTNTTQVMVNTYTASVATARANMSAAQTTLTNAITAQQNAAAALAKDQKTLALQKAGATQADIDAQTAQATAARANITTLQAQIAKTVLRAPFAGIVTRQDAKVGSTVTPGVSLVTLSSNGGYEIDCYVPEADIAKVALDDAADITLDAYGDGVPFTAKVVSIDPAETIKDGVSTYKVILAFVSVPKPVKSGMTANIDIVTATRESAIAIPARAVYEKDGTQLVQLVQSDGSTIERAVKTGIQGADGALEVMQGLSEGDRVVTSAGK